MALEHPIRKAALEYIAAGFSVIPIAPDGSKGPATPQWKIYQNRKPSPYEITQLFRGLVGIAVIGGGVSGGLELMDLETAEIVKLWMDLVEAACPGLLGRLPQVRTPKGGSHFYLRSTACEGNQKLAMELDAEGKQRVLIETRGEGGYVVSVPSPAQCHPTGKTYQHVSGPSITETPTVTPEERVILLNAARALGRVPLKKLEHAAHHQVPVNGLRPGDDFNAKASWEEVLTPAGWTTLRQAGDITYWKRPGKDGTGISATTGRCGDNLYVFSSNAAPFEPDTAYTKFAAYAMLNHSGNFEAAAKDLAGRGFGAAAKAADPAELAKSGAEIESFHEEIEAKKDDKKAASGGEDGGEKKKYKKRDERHKGNTAKYFEGKAFLPERLSREVCSERTFISTPISDNGRGARIYAYENGVYMKGGESIVVDMCRGLLDEENNDNRVDQVKKNITMSTKVEYDSLNVSAMDLINVKNGMLEWSTGKLYPHDPKYLSVIQVNTIYDPAAKCDALDSFLDDILPKDEAPIIEEYMGYLLTPDTSFEKCLAIVGEGGNGKTTLMGVMQGVLGPKNISTFSIQHLSDERFSPAGLIGKLANFYDELPSTTIKDTSTFKMIVSGSEIKAEEKGQSPFSFKPFSRLVFATNKMPRANDRSQAFFDRFIFIKLPNRIRGTSKMVRKYHEVLLRVPGLASAFLNRAVAGLRRITDQNRFSPSPSSVLAIEEYRKECNSTYDFVREACTFENPTSWLSTSELYGRYKGWALDNGRKPMSKREFSNALREMNVSEKRYDHGYGWEGIGWLGGRPPETSGSEVSEFAKNREHNDF
jgi:putative DNA primase/helicase